MSGWTFAVESAPANGDLVVGPGTPPLGLGSAHMTTAAASGGMLLFGVAHAGTRLDQLSRLEFSTYQSLANSSTATISLQVEVDYDVTSPNPPIHPWQGRLTFIPETSTAGDPPRLGMWQTWDARSTAGWFATKAPGKTNCPLSPVVPRHRCTLAEVLAFFPNAAVSADVPNVTSGLIGFKLGSGLAGFESYVDALTVGVSGNDSRYDFEALAPTATPTASPTSTPTATTPPTPTITPMATDTATATAIATLVPTQTPVATDAPSPTSTATPTETPVPTDTSTPTDTPAPPATNTPIPPSGGGGGGTSHAAPTAVLVHSNPDGAGGGGAGGGLGPVGPAPAIALGGASAPEPPAPSAPASAPAPVSTPPTALVVVVLPDTTTRFTASLAPSRAVGAGGANLVLAQVVVQPIDPSDFLAQIPAGMRIEITAANQTLPSNVSQAQLGSLGGGNADPLSPPVDLQLHAKDIVTNADVPLPDGALAQTYLVSLPVLAEPTNPDQTFTWLIAVQEDGQFLGYMRYPSTFDPQTNSLVIELTGQGLQTISALPVILSPSRVQTFLTDVHTFSSPFTDGVDFGVLGPVWNSYSVLAPQVGGRIGILSPDGSDMIWIDATGVGPAGDATADNPPVSPPIGASTPADLAIVETDATGAP